MNRVRARAILANVARSFFDNYSESAEILKINPVPLKNITIILAVTHSTRTIKLDKFEAFCRSTIDGLKEEFGCINPTLHKLLFHSCALINYLQLPLGLFSEEALEASHQFVKAARDLFSRKNNRKNTNIDMNVYLQFMSDPVILAKSFLNYSQAEGRFMREAATFLNGKI